MKKYLSIIFLLLPVVLFAQQTYVPDDNFEQALIYLGYDSPPLNDSVPTKNINTVTVLVISYNNIHNLTGIEDFTALQKLVCIYNQLKSLDLSKNTALQELNCNWNQLQSLDISKNTALQSLFCDWNQLTSLDLTKNTVLTDLFCQYNQLISLDVSNNTALKRLVCNDNQLTSLDLTKNTRLKYLNCSKNDLTSLDVSKNTALKQLHCYNNQLTSLDVSNCSALQTLYCSDNYLTSLNLSKNTALQELHCGRSQLKSLDVSNNTALDFFYCEVNYLTSLNVKNGNNKRMRFYAQNNPDLYCIQVDDSAYSAIFWASFKDKHAQFSEDCGYTGVEDLMKINNILSVSPNPAHDYIDIAIDNHALQGMGAIKVYDVLGVCVLEHPAVSRHPSARGELIRIDVSGLATGVYFLRIDFGSKNTVRKIVVE